MRRKQKCITDEQRIDWFAKHGFRLTKVAADAWCIDWEDGNKVDWLEKPTPRATIDAAIRARKKGKKR